MMTSSKRFIVTGPLEDARDSFEATLKQTFGDSDCDWDNYSSNDLASKMNASDTGYFLVMPHGFRYNLHGDESGMTEELELMCGGRPSESKVEKRGTSLVH